MLVILSFSEESEKRKFEYLYQKYKKLLLYKAHGILRDYDLAEDAASEAFIRVYHNLHKIDDPDSNQTAAFLVTIVKNVSLTLYQKENRNRTVDTEEFDREDDFDLEESVIASVAAEEMMGVLDKLKDELKTVFLLKYAHDLSHKEIGKLLDISENNVTVRIHRAKTKLMKLLREEGYVYGKS